MANLDQASRDLKPTLEHVDLTVQKYGKVADDADAFINGDGLAQLSDLIGEIAPAGGQPHQILRPAQPPADQASVRRPAQGI